MDAPVCRGATRLPSALCVRRRSPGGSGGTAEPLAIPTESAFDAVQRQEEQAINRVLCCALDRLDPPNGQPLGDPAGGLLLTEPTRASLPEVPGLATPQARALIERLGSPEISDPRLEIPSEQWAALIDFVNRCSFPRKVAFASEIETNSP
jgi:hypothetical protein